MDTTADLQIEIEQIPLPVELVKFVFSGWFLWFFIDTPPMHNPCMLNPWSTIPRPRLCPPKGTEYTLTMTVPNPHLAAYMTSPWSYSGPPPTKCHIMTILGPYYDHLYHIITVLWPYYDCIMTILWPNYDHILTVTW